MDNDGSMRGGQVAGWVDPEPIRRPPPDPFHVTQILAPDPGTQPNVTQPHRYKVQGRTNFIADGAEYEVVHMILGLYSDGGFFGPGDRIKASDLGENVDIDRLLRLEAIKPIAVASDKK